MGAAAHVFVDDLSLPVLPLSGEDRHHLERVLRLRPGEEVTASDGRGGWRPCRFGPSGTLTPVGEVQRSSPPEPGVTIGFALTKGERPEWVVQKLTEAGVDVIVPFVAARTVVRWDGEKGARRLDRLRMIARMAAMQSRRVWLPEVQTAQPFASLVSALPAGKAALAHPEGGLPTLAHPTILVGPEGGFSDDELSCGLPTTDLGPGILRAETAAMAAGLLLCALRAGVVAPAD
jgi:16S rRNA (uracil1498-N3)-methyltransferase